MPTRYEPARWIAAEGENVIEFEAAQFLENFADIIAGLTDAGEMADDIDAGGLADLLR